MRRQNYTIVYIKQRRWFILTPTPLFCPSNPHLSVRPFPLPVSISPPTTCVYRPASCPAANTQTIGYMIHAISLASSILTIYHYSFVVSYPLLTSTISNSQGSRMSIAVLKPSMSADVRPVEHAGISWSDCRLYVCVCTLYMYMCSGQRPATFGAGFSFAYMYIHIYFNGETFTVGTVHITSGYMYTCSTYTLVE